MIRIAIHINFLYLIQQNLNFVCFSNTHIPFKSLLKSLTFAMVCLTDYLCGLACNENFSPVYRKLHCFCDRSIENFTVTFVTATES